MMPSPAAVWAYAKVVSAMDNGAGNVFTAVVSEAVSGWPAQPHACAACTPALLQSCKLTCCSPRVKAELPVGLHLPPAHALILESAGED